MLLRDLLLTSACAVKPPVGFCRCHSDGYVCLSPLSKRIWMFILPLQMLGLRIWGCKGAAVPRHTTSPKSFGNARAQEKEQFCWLLPLLEEGASKRQTLSGKKSQASLFQFEKETLFQFEKLMSSKIRGWQTTCDWKQRHFRTEKTSARNFHP